MKPERIKDIPSIKQLVDQMEQFDTFRSAWPILRPFFKKLGVDVKGIEKHFPELGDLKTKVEELASIPDRFNDLLGERGWIIHELMNVEVAQLAIEKAKAGNPEDAEQVLIDYYDVETVEWMLNSMKSIKAFQPRMRLARKALIDYQEERFHACIPVVLALLDGLVNELHERQRGFFAEGTDLEAWDSISAHSKGLQKLASLFRQTRKKTRTEEISLPYRHGIMHGMDLGYDNKMVAAKTWAALFATGDWARKAEKGLLNAPPLAPELTLVDTLKKLQEIEKMKSRLGAWEPRALKVGENIPATGGPDVYEENTPERRLAEFLSYWKARNYGYMAKCLPQTTPNSNRPLPVKVREQYGSKSLKSFEFINIQDVAAAVTQIEAQLEYEERGKVVETVFKFRLIYEDANGETLVRGTDGGSWTVYNWWSLV